MSVNPAHITMLGALDSQMDRQVSTLHFRKTTLPIYPLCLISCVLRHPENSRESITAAPAAFIFLLVTCFSFSWLSSLRSEAMFSLTGAHRKTDCRQQAPLHNGKSVYRQAALMTWEQKLFQWSFFGLFILTLGSRTFLEVYPFRACSCSLTFTCSLIWPNSHQSERQNSFPFPW